MGSGLSLLKQAHSLPSPLTPWPRAVLHSEPGFWPKIHSAYVKSPLLFSYWKPTFCQPVGETATDMLRI